MNKIFAITLILLFLHALPAQQVINNIILPDSMGGMPDGAFCCVYNEANNTIYIGGQDFVFVLDGVINQKIARIPVSGRVTSILWVPGENKIFCAHYHDAKVTVIDCTTNSVIATLIVGIHPIGLEYNPTDNKVYCANKHSRDIDVIDASTNSSITTMMFPDEPWDMLYQAIGDEWLRDNVIWCAGGQSYGLFYGSTNLPGYQAGNQNADYSAVALDTTDHKTYFSDRAHDRVEIFSTNSTNCWVGDQPIALVWNATSNRVYCANYGSDNINVIDGVGNNVVATIPAGDGPVELCWNSLGNKIYCLNSESNDITVINGITNTVITTVPAKIIDTLDNYNGVKPHLAVNSQNNKLYFPQQFYREVRIIDGSSNNVIEDVRLGASPWSLTWNSTSSKLYSINRNSGAYPVPGSISIIDGVSQRPITTLTAGIAPSAVVWNSTNNTIYCANSYSNDVRVIDGFSDQLIDTIAVGGGPGFILWNSTSNKIYTTNASGNSVSIIDGATHTFLTTVPAGSIPTALAWNSINNKVYCTNFGSNNITVIDGFSNIAIATIPVGQYPTSLVWNATNNQIYCVNSGYPGALSIIDGLMDTVITNLSIDYIDNLVWNETENKVYCSEYGNNIIVIDGASNQIADTIRLGGGNQINVDQFWNDQDNRLYCYTTESIGSYPSYQYMGRLFVVDGASDSVLTVMFLDENYIGSSIFERPELFAFDAQRNRIFLADYSNCWISVIDPTATGIVSEPLVEVPERFLLQQNYPNPFNPSTTISWQLAVGSQVKLTVYNVTGEKIAILVNERQPAGSHSVRFDASGLASGVYLYRLETDQFVETKKMVLMR